MCSKFLFISAFIHHDSVYILHLFIPVYSRFVAILFTSVLTCRNCVYTSPFGVYNQHIFLSQFDLRLYITILFLCCNSIYFFLYSATFYISHLYLYVRILFIPYLFFVLQMFIHQNYISVSQLCVYLSILFIHWNSIYFCVAILCLYLRILFM